jgi:hypothetical protein
MDLLKSKIRNVFPFPANKGRRVQDDYEPIPAGGCPNGDCARTVIVDYGNPDAWHGTSSPVPATTVACTDVTEALDGVLGALDAREFVFARLMGLADALGRASALRSTL